MNDRDDNVLLELDGVTKRWRDFTVFEDVDLVLRRGELTWLAGDNGVGKTTLLRVATGILVPDGGEVRLLGLRPDRDRRRYLAHIGFLPAGDRGLYARLTTRQNLELAASLALLRGPAHRRAVDGALEHFDLHDLEHRRVDRMSMGQRQRVRLAITLLHQPDVVLLDEPRTSLDERGIEMVAAAIDAITARGGTALYCSPTGDHGGLEADNAYVLRDGKLHPW